MTTIVPPTGPQPIPTTSGSPPVAVVQSPPPALARLPLGQLLQATVTSQTAKDVFQVQTPMGQLTLQTALVLPKGGALVLQMQSHSPFQFQINSLNGAAPPLAPKAAKPGTLTPQTMGTGSPTSASSATGTGQASAAPKMTAGSVLQATLMRPLTSPGGSGALQTPGSLTSSVTAPTGTPTGNTATTPVSSTSGATTGKPTATSPFTPAQASQAGAKMAGNPANPGMVKATPGTITQTSGYLPTGSQLSVKINNIQLPNPVASSSAPETTGTSKTPPSLMAGTTLRGTVTGSTPSGHPIVQTRAGVFSLTTQTVVPRGSVLTLDVVTPPTAPNIKPGMMPSLHETMFSSRKWPALEEVIQLVQENNPVAAQQVINNFLPRPNATLAASIIFFLTALRGGEMRTLVGDDIMRLIERTRPNLTGRVTEDFTSLARIADEPSGDWRVALIPLNTGSDIEQIRMLLRHHGGEEEDDESGNSDTRFVVDVVLSRFGRMQLDGLVRNNGKSLDLIVRSEMTLSDEMQNDIRTIFQDAADLTGLQGGVNFQATPPDFIEITDPTGEHDLGFVV